MAELNHDAVDEQPRDAASVVLLREAGDQLEAFLLKRSGSKTVMGDAYVFPGGKVDPDDADPAQLDRVASIADPGQRIGEPALTNTKAGALFIALSLIHI